MRSILSNSKGEVEMIPFVINNERLYIIPANYPYGPRSWAIDMLKMSPDDWATCIRGQLEHTRIVFYRGDNYEEVFDITGNCIELALQAHRMYYNETPTLYTGIVFGDLKERWKPKTMLKW